MARLKRLVAPGHPHYVVQRALPGAPAFPHDDDFRRFLDALKLVSSQQDVAIHAFALLPDSVHLVATPQSADAISLMMQAIGRSYVAGFNRSNQRVGPLWRGRFRAAPLEADEYLIPFTCYVETLPVSTGLVLNAVEYKYSSASHHCDGQASPLVTDHAVFWRLGNTPFEREASYARLLDRPLAPEHLEAIEKRAEMGWAAGSTTFLAEIEAAAGRRAATRSPGRPSRRVDMSPNKLAPK